jgi:hypothetical protein
MYVNDVETKMGYELHNNIINNKIKIECSQEVRRKYTIVMQCFVS